MAFLTVSGCQVLIDDQDYADLSKIRWTIAGPVGYRYVIRQSKIKNLRRYLHRLIMNAPDGVFVDHINGNILDNRRSNLRLCTHQENMMNRRGVKNSEAGIKGVFRNPRSKKNPWRASIIFRGKRFNLGVFPTKELAGDAYREMSIKLQKEFSVFMSRGQMSDNA